LDAGNHAVQYGSARVLGPERGRRLRRPRDPRPP
jgi:hypothetical protein